MRLPTVGGKQFWTDHQWRQGWRIQQNAITGHWRLLDADNFRRAWGSRLHCQQFLDRQVPTRSISAPQIVVLLHGLLRSANSMKGLGGFLQKNMDCQIVYFEYASTRRCVADHAQALLDVLEGFPDQLPLHLIGHSLGNIIVRHLIGDLKLAAKNDLLSRVQSVVMLGPPNQGASLARQLSRLGIFGWITGRSGLQLGPGWQELQSRLAIPPCPFGIVAGRLVSPLMKNPLLNSHGDFVVTVEETYLDGASDSMEVPYLHSFLMDYPEVQEGILHFLQAGKFKPVC